MKFEYWNSFGSPAMCSYTIAFDVILLIFLMRFMFQSYLVAILTPIARNTIPVCIAILADRFGKDALTNLEKSSYFFVETSFCIRLYVFLFALLAVTNEADDKTQPCGKLLVYHIYIYKRRHTFFVHHSAMVKFG